jgi:hypothetical protein
MSTDSDLDARIGAALDTRARNLAESDLRPAIALNAATARSRSAPNRRRWGAPVLVAAAIATIAIVVALIVDSPSTQRVRPVAPPSVSTPMPSITTTPPVASGFDLGYQPLYPFATLAGAQAWQRSKGSQPWHADAGATALAFTSGWLGFTEINIVTSARTDADGAHIGVGYRDPNGVPHTAAVLHLVRFGRDADSPWEVVGSDDDPASFSLDTPAYGTAVKSPVMVGGRIAGVDENIRVTVRHLADPAPVATFCCTPAGSTGPTGSRWGATVPFTAPAGDVLTIVAQTGGHLQEVERFAIQGVRTSP